MKRAGNPFTRKAIRARERYERISRPTAHDEAMRAAFPLGVGYGRAGGSERLERTISRAVEAQKCLLEARWREAQAAAYDAGEINAQGRRPSKEADKNRERRERLNERQRVALEYRENRQPWEVPPSLWADACRQFGGSGRKLVIEEHREDIRKAIAEGKEIPAEVLADM